MADPVVVEIRLPLPVPVIAPIMTAIGTLWPNAQSIHGEGMLRISVTDNGKGGAAIAAGSGLAGVERRLGTFDGVLAVSSPAGGPTMVTMEIPCA